MNTCNTPPFDDEGLKIQSTRQCPVTVNVSVSLLPLPCHAFVTTQLFPASGAVASGFRATALAPAGRLRLAQRLSVPASANSTATARPVRVCLGCRCHQANAIGIAGRGQRRIRIVSSRERSPGAESVAVVICLVAHPSSIRDELLLCTHARGRA